jgi:hypothetical protein
MMTFTLASGSILGLAAVARKTEACRRGETSMKGHIRERSPGRWAIVIDLPDPETGKRRRKWHSFHGTKREAQVECSRRIWEMKGGLYVEPAKMTVRQFLDHAT